MRREIIEALCKNASGEEAGRARACGRGTGNIITELLDAGLHRRLVLNACTAATGIEKAPSAWFKESPVLEFGDLDVSLCETYSFVPIAIEDGELCLAFGDPVIAAERESLPLPPHRAYLATPTKVARAVKRLLARLPVEQTLTRQRPGASGESSALSNKSRKKKRNVRRAASAEESEPHYEPPPPSDRTVELPPSPAPRRTPPPPAPRPAPPPETVAAERRQEPVEDRGKAREPDPPQPPAIRVLPRGKEPPRTHGPLDPPLSPAAAMRMGSVLDPPLPPARARTEPVRPPKPRSAPRPVVSSASNASGGGFLKLLVLGALVVVAVVVVRTNVGKKKRADPADPPPVVAQGKVVLSARQRSKIDHAAEATSSVDALNSLTDAINLDPSSIEARDALLARARLYLVGGEAERARRDLLRLQLRKDVEPLRGEVDALLADIVKRFGKGSDVAPQARDAGPQGGDAGAPVTIDAGSFAAP